MVFLFTKMFRSVKRYQKISVPYFSNVTLNKEVNSSVTLKSSLTFRDKLKATIHEKWGRYWKDLINDYVDVFKETVENSRKSPQKSLVSCSVLGFIWVCFKTNPDDIHYRDNVIKCSNEVLLVAKSVRNKATDHFLTFAEACNNLGVLRRLSFGLFSVMWYDNYSEELGLYHTKCTHLKPQFSKLQERIVDIGFLGKWWRLNRVMQDYDIDDEEWYSK